MSDDNKVARLITGIVTSDQRDLTCTVEIKWARRHPRYKKVLRRSTKLHVHDPKNESKIGDSVEIRQCRPISKTKTWELVRILDKA